MKIQIHTEHKTKGRAAITEQTTASVEKNPSLLSDPGARSPPVGPATRIMRRTEKPLGALADKGGPLADAVMPRWHARGR
ncbi:MAG: hypothetical protein ACI81V_000114 [Lentimonas sp.]|jgi:hypothetical protein